MNPDDARIIENMTALSTLMVSRGYSNDPRKWREVVGSLYTGCVPSTEKSGPDCLNEGLPAEKRGCERKSTIGKNPGGSYTGISNLPTWEEQEQYLQTKIRNLGRHYFDRFDPYTGKLVESWSMTGEKAYEILLPKIKKDFIRKKQKALASGKEYADGRLSASICWTEIKQYGVIEYQ